jgi:hypothetical protein
VPYFKSKLFIHRQKNSRKHLHEESNFSIMNLGMIEKQESLNANKAMSMRMKKYLSFENAKYCVKTISDVQTNKVLRFITLTHLSSDQKVRIYDNKRIKRLPHLRC